jgi:hypothetical protein
MQPLRARLIVGCVAAAAGAALVAAEPSDCSSGCTFARYWSVSPVPKDLKTISDRERERFPEDVYLSEQDRDKRVGLAFSGGGTRSAAATLGQLRGLRANGWLEHVTYVSAISGGAWASVPFTFTKRSLDDFLGIYEAPGTLVKEHVETIDNGRLSQAIAHSGLLAAGIPEGAGIAAQQYAKTHSSALLTDALSLTNHLRREADRLDKTYARLLGTIFVDGKKGDELIEPGTTNATRLFSLNTVTADDMSHAAPTSDFVVEGTGRPFLIATGTLVSSRADYAYPLLMPVEYTPLYVGIRQPFGAFGGSYIWPWAYDPIALGTPAKDENGNDVILVRNDGAHKFTLADVVASTGAAPELAAILGPAMLPTQYQGKAQFAAQVFPAFRHVSIQGGKTVTLSDSLPHADGGGEDNLGIMPLLARQLKYIIVFLNTDTPFAENNDDLQSLFVAAHPPGLSGDKRHNVVFEQRLHKEVTDALTKARDDKKPQVFCGSGWNVLPNERFGVWPYAGLNICFVYNAKIPQWEDEFKNNKDVLKIAQDIKNFPWFSTFEQDKPNLIKLSTAEVNLLSNLTAWTLRNEETASQIQKYIAPFPSATK